MKRILAIDPGTTKSAFVVWDGTVVECGELDNYDLLCRMRERTFGGAKLCAIEMIASYGMAVGKEVFETCVYIGRFIERAGMPVELIYRHHIKLALCGTKRAKDSNIRTALIDKHGPCGTKKAPGALYGVSKHIWAALAVADYVSGLEADPNEQTT